MKDNKKNTIYDASDSLLCVPVNFCELPHDQLIQIIDFLDEKIITEKSKMQQTLIDNICVEKKWHLYGDLTVTPDKIIKTGYRTETIMTSEKFSKTQALFINSLTGK